MWRIIAYCDCSNPTSPSGPYSTTAQQAKQYVVKLRVRVNRNLIEGMPKSIYPWDGAEVHPMVSRLRPSGTVRRSVSG